MKPAEVLQANQEKKLFFCNHRVLQFSSPAFGASEFSRNYSSLKNEASISLPNNWEMMITAVPKCMKYTVLFYFSQNMFAC